MFACFVELILITQVLNSLKCVIMLYFFVALCPFILFLYNECAGICYWNKVIRKLINVYWMFFCKGLFCAKVYIFCLFRVFQCFPQHYFFFSIYFKNYNKTTAKKKKKWQLYFVQVTRLTLSILTIISTMVW